MQDINLIPQEELQEQNQAKAIKLSSITTIVILIVAGAVSGYLLYVKSNIESQIKQIDTESESLRQEIQTKSEVEIKSRNLDKKYLGLKQVFEQQFKYSLLMEEVKARKPISLELETLDVKIGKTNLTGTADNYIAISEFVNNLLNNNFSGGNTQLQKLFKSVSLNSVSLDSSKNRIQFMISVEFDQTLLK